MTNSETIIKKLLGTVVKVVLEPEDLGKYEEPSRIYLAYADGKEVQLQPTGWESEGIDVQ